MTQQENIKKCYEFLKEEGVVINKDVALQWIIDIGLNYDGAENIEELKSVIDEIIAYAKSGLEKFE
jgi:transcriptional regulator with AAA-type ATPase domain